MSNAVGLERVSAIVGYLLTKGNFQESSPNLPMRITILSEANTANQSGLETDGVEVTSAQQAGTLYGYGSPIHRIMSILRPNSGGIGGIPTIVYAQAEPGGAAAKVVEVTATGTATGNGTHTVTIAGRTGLSGSRYDINIVTGDTIAEIAQKIEDAVNNVLGAPVTAASTNYEATLTTKWRGATAQELVVSVDTNGNDLGLTYAVAQTQAGSGTPSIAAALAQFGNAWNTIVINGYSTNSGIMDALESFNGIPDAENPTGRYVGTVFKPFIALTGSVAANPSSITDARLANCTIAICPAPLSEGFTFEAAANMCVLFARQAQDSPHLDVQNKSYPDMPTPASIGVMADDNERDAIVKKGCSTVDLVNGRYKVVDFVTTYHPIGEEPPQFRWCRNLIIDWNVRYGYFLLEQINVVGHVIAEDNDTVTASNVIKPKSWKGVVDKYADNLATRALIVEPSFMQDSITVAISTINPDRLETFFRYKRSGFARIAATTAQAGFNFGTLN